MSESSRGADNLSQDEQEMAALAHATIIFSAAGLIGPLVIWGTQREKSAFVAFQALQAAAYQFLLLVAGLVAGALYMCTFLSFPFTALLAAPFGEGAALCFPFMTFSCSFGILFLLMLAWLAYVGYGLFAAVSVLQGSDFRYVILGPWLRRYLERANEPGPVRGRP
jgi:uncharacterized Tic20 family protein